MGKKQHTFGDKMLTKICKQCKRKFENIDSDFCSHDCAVINILDFAKEICK